MANYFFMFYEDIQDMDLSNALQSLMALDWRLFVFIMLMSYKNLKNLTASCTSYYFYKILPIG